MDAFGDHTFACASMGCRTDRHDALKHAFALICEAAGLNPSVEKNLGFESGKRPADVYLPLVAGVHFFLQGFIFFYRGSFFFTGVHFFLHRGSFFFTQRGSFFFTQRGSFFFTQKTMLRRNPTDVPTWGVPR